MARKFNSATGGDQDNYLIVNGGGITTLGNAAWTVGWIWNPTNNTHEGGIFRGRNGGTLNNDVRIYNWDSGNIFLSVFGSNSPYSGGGWFSYFVTKPAGNGVTARSHEYSFATDSWTHANFSTTVDSNGANTNDQWAIGTLDPASNQGMRGDLAVMGAWIREMTDAEIVAEGFPYSLQSWYASAPNALWVLDQSSTTQKVIDATGGGANENTLNKTTVATNSVPVFSYGVNPFASTEVPPTPVTQPAVPTFRIARSAPQFVR